MTSYKSDFEYKEQARVLRRVAKGFSAADGMDLRAPLTPAQKRRITRYYNEYHALTSKPHKVIYNLRPDRLEKVQRYSGQELKKDFKAAIIPVFSPDHHIKLKVPDRGPVQVIEDDRVYTDIPLDREALSVDPDGYLSGLLDWRHDEYFFIEAADNQVTRYGGKNSDLKRIIMELMNKYSEQNSKDPQSEKDPNSHHWRNWLVGLRSTGFKRYSDYDKLRRKLLAARKENRKTRYELYQAAEAEEKAELAQVRARIQSEMSPIQRRAVREHLAEMTRQKKSAGEKIQYLRRVLNPPRSMRGTLGKRVR